MGGSVGELTPPLPGTLAAKVPGRNVPRGRSDHSREEIVVVQRARLLDAFVQVVDEVGYADTHVADVCARARISTREFYRIFSSKEECLLAALDTGSSQVIEQGREVFAQARGPWERRVAQALEAMLWQLAENPAFAQFSIVEAPRAFPESMSHFNIIVNEFERLFSEKPSSGFESAGVCGDVPAALEKFLAGGAIRRLAECVRCGRVDQLAALLPEVTYFVTVFVVGEERALAAAEWHARASA